MEPTDRVSVETPEQIALEFPLAGVGSRFLALALDTLLQVVLYTVVVLLAILATVGTKASLGTRWGPAFAVLFLFCIYWGYFAAFEIFWHGQTPGKRALRIRVVKDTGRPITIIEGVGRNLLRVVDGFCFYAVGVVTMLISRQNRRIGDYVAGTIVVHEAKSEQIQPDWTSPIASQPDEGAEAYLKLGEEDLSIIETYLHRRWELAPLVRVNTAIRICDRLQQKAGLVREDGQTDDDFLEFVARKMRDQARFRGR